MRIVLVHNPKAGSKKHEGQDFIKALKKAGHKPSYQSPKEIGAAKALKKKIDLVLVAGGDGTVGRVARRLVATASEVPLAVLPVGTANNLARSLGFCLSGDELINQLDKGKCDTFDVGLAHGPWGERYFFEGAGAGLFADYLRVPKKDGKKDEPKSKTAVMRSHVRELRRRLETYRAREWQIELDGSDLSGRYLLWHAMNIRSVGPVLTLAGGARTNDGAFDFVAAREEDRALLLDYFDARVAGKRRKFPLRAKRFTGMGLRWKKWPLHFDDQIWPGQSDKPRAESGIELLVKGAALRIWRIE